MTQYDHTTGSQAILYTLQNFIDRTLLIIDGGWLDNSEPVRNIILEKGSTVNAWILMYYHSDHIGAFNTIYQDPQGIEINQVYASPYNRELFCSVAKDWDGIDTPLLIISLRRTT